LAAAIKKALGVDAVLEAGRVGSFEIYKDGTLVFSKLQRSRFPSSEQEVIDLLKA
jgi:selT/selW/selH-like putative selenoprotein